MFTNAHNISAVFHFQPTLYSGGSPCGRIPPQNHAGKMQRNALYNFDPMQRYRAKKDSTRRSVLSKYNILGFISSGTYGRVYKAQSKDDESRLYAIKKFKPDKEGEVVTYTGISQSAIREIAVGLPFSHKWHNDLKHFLLTAKSRN